jgi:hypothetical protein
MGSCFAKENIASIRLEYSTANVKEYQFTYKDKYILKSQFIIYEEAKLLEDFKLALRYRTKLITFAKLIEDTKSDTYVFITSEYEITFVLSRDSSGTGKHGYYDSAPFVFPWLIDIVKSIKNKDNVYFLQQIFYIKDIQNLVIEYLA